MKIVKKEVLILFGIIIIQLAISIFFGSTKKSYYIDDLWSIEISQGTFDFIDEKYANKWNETATINEKLTITGDEKFNFKKVIAAVKKDGVHPPLYYLTINFFGSLFNKVPLTTIMLFLNAFFSIGITIFLFLIFKLIYNKKEFAEKYSFLYFLPSLVWALSIGTNLLFMLLRMYLMMLFFLLALILIIILILKRKDGEEKGDFKSKIKLFPFFFIVLFLGFLTQYYFSFVSFIAVALAGFALLIRKDFKILISLALLSGIALLLAIACYPYFFDGMFSSYQSQMAKMEMASFSIEKLFNNLLQYSTLFIVNFIPQLKSLAIVVVIVLVLLFLLLIITIIRRIVKVYKESERGFFYDLIIAIKEWIVSTLNKAGTIYFVPFLFFSILLLVSTGSANSRYMAITYPLLLVLFAIGLYKVFEIAALKKTKYIIVGAFLLVFAVNSFYYVPKEYANKIKKIEPYFDYPAVALTSLGTIPGAYSGDIEALLDIFTNFPAEVHSIESLYFTNVLGYKMSDNIEKNFYEYNSEMVKEQDLIKDFPKYIRGNKKDKKLVLFVSKIYKNYIDKIFLYTKKKTGLKHMKKLTTLDQFGFDYIAYVLY